MPKSALVVGSPRSGTSLTASIFATKNYFVTDNEQTDVEPGDSNNPFGYWEAKGVIEANVEIFRAVGYEPHNTWMLKEITDTQAHAIGELTATPDHRTLVKSYEQHTPWMWKDPRFCYTLGYWWGLVDQTATGVLLVTRDPEAVYKSFRRIGWCEGGPSAREVALRRIRGHFDNARSIVRSQNIPHVTVDYDEYLQNPSAAAAKIGEHFELDILPDDLNVRRDLNHSTTRGQIGQAVYRLVKKFPRGPTRFIAGLLPRRLTEALLPERQYTTRKDGP